MAIKTVTASDQQAVVQEGAQAIMTLMQSIKVISDATCAQDDESEDARDYRVIVSLIESSINENLSPALSGKHREGYLRALADLLTLNADGCAPGSEWNPLEATSKAFAEMPISRSH